MSNTKMEQPEFLAEVLEIQEQIDALKKRLELVEENRNKVRPKIYEKVKSDYELKLENLFESLQPFQEKIQNQIAEFESDMESHQNVLNEKQEELEEYQLRYFAGEFSEEDYEPIQSNLQEHIDKAQEEISGLKNMVSEFREHLAFITGESSDDSQPEDVEAPDDDEKPEKIDDAEEDDEGEPLEMDESENSEFEDAPEDKEPAHFEETFMTDSANDTSEEEQGPAQVLEHDSAQDEEYSWKGIPVLDVVDGDFSGESYTIDKERITMGRGPNNDIQLATDTSVSRHHAQIVLENGQYILVDLDSSNGTSVNGMRVSRVTLRPDDEIAIGVSKMIIKDQN